MARVPSQKTPFKLSDTIAAEEKDKDGKVTFRAYGTDRSELSGHVFYIGSAPLERYIAIKAFFDNISINLAKDSEFENIGTRNYQVIKEKSGKMSIDIGLTLPAHSTNEAMNNLAKIEELQKLIMPGKWSASDNSLRDKNANLDYTFSGVSDETRITTPLFHAYFKNIINNGRDGLPHSITDYSQLISHGFPCYIDAVNYEPDKEAGYFEFDNYLFPKIIRLNLTLNYETESLFDETREMELKTILPFKLDGGLSRYDTSLFPFGVKIDPDFEKTQSDVTVKEMNAVDGFKSFVFVSMAHNPSGNVKRYVKFKPFIDNFSRNVKTQIQLAPTANSTIHSRVLQNGVTPDMTEYSLSISIPSEDLAEAIKNCGKIQYLMRMFYKKYSNGLETIKINRDDLKVEDVKQKLMVYVPSMIEMPGAKAVTDDLDGMFKNAVPLYLRDLKFEMDMGVGFFEVGNRVYPKAMSLTFSLVYNRADMIRNYGLRKGGGDPEENGNTYYIHQPGTDSRQPLISAEEAQLFPFARKTSKIGDPK